MAQKGRLPEMKNNDIFIASSSFDYPTYGPVVEELESYGHNVTVYEADKVSLGEKPLKLHLDSFGNLLFEYDNKTVNLETIKSAWYRRPGLIASELDDKAKQMRIEEEIKELQSSIWHTIPESAWLNSPKNIQSAGEKLYQLKLASKVGFSIPETVVSNKWDSICSHLTDDEIIMKMPYGILYDNNKLKALYTTILDKNKVHTLKRENNIPFPGILQAYIPKAREWRVTVVGDNVFDAAIYTSEDAKDDWRKHQQGTEVEFKKENLDVHIEQQCITMLGKLGLKFGAFDFIEGEDGKITFLEMNPNGQFMWLEKMLDLPISRAIADELIKISQKA